eukprot:Skav206203  [mRNA]  locus=scaffold1844:395252:395841:- [translate_table: standard]
MADCADHQAAWRDFAPCCLSDATWKVAAESRDAVLSHRSCPWGGHLIKIDSKTLGHVNGRRSMFIQDAPEDPCDVLVRPEVRAMSQPSEEVDLRCIETYAPGHALLQRTNSMFMVRLASEAWLGGVVFLGGGSFR